MVLLDRTIGSNTPVRASLSIPMVRSISAHMGSSPSNSGSAMTVDVALRA
jgi:hypothetical protein